MTRSVAWIAVYFAMASTASAIVNGMDVASDSPYAKATVLIVRKSDGAACTGVLLTDNIVLTAAHCMFKKTAEGSRRLPANDIHVVFGVHPKAGQAQVRQADATVIREPYHHTPANTSKPSEIREKQNQPDLALVRFRGFRPPGTMVARVAGENDTATQPLTIVGYGRANGFINDKDVAPLAGTLRQFNFPSVKIGKNKLIAANQTAGGACSGDSGGPFFLRNTDGPPTVVGVYSHGSSVTFRRDNEKSPRHNFCSGNGAKSYATNLVPQREWIAAQIQALRYDRMLEGRSK